MEAEVINIEKTVAPKLRFKEFKAKWNKKELGNICSFFSGGTPASTNKEFYSGTIPFIGSGDIYDSQVYSFITEKALESSSAKIVKQGDLLCALYGANSGEVAISKINGAINQAILCIRSKEDFIEFIYFLLSYNKERVVAKYLQGGQGNLSAKIIKKLNYYFPSFPEQQKIASFLSAVDEKIQQLTRKKELLEQYKKGVMQQLFSGKLRFKGENGKEFSKWEEKLLGEIAVKISTKNKSNNVNFVLTNSATRGIVSQDEYFDREIANQNNLEGYYIVAVDDFVYNPRISVHAPVGPIKRNKLKEGVMSPLYSIFRFKEKNLEYFEYFFETNGWHTYLESVSNKGARHDRMNIAQSDFFKMPIPFPCVEERKKITDFLNKLTFKIECADKVLTQTQTFKKGLLQQMFV